MPDSTFRSAYGRKETGTVVPKPEPKGLLDQMDELERKRKDPKVAKKPESKADKGDLDLDGVW